MLLFFLLSAFGLVPEGILIGFTFIAGWLIVRSLRGRRWAILGSASVLTLQAAILTAWMNCWTATSAFEHFSGPDQGVVCDPTVERIMKWLFGAGAICMLIVLARVVFRRLDALVRSQQEQRSLRRSAGLALAVEVFILLSMLGNMNTFRSMSSSTLYGQSPDRMIDVGMVPMNCMIDVEGLVIYRQKGTLWWHSLGRIGDILTGCSGGSFQWSDDSENVTLNMNCRGGAVEKVFTHAFKNQ